MADDFTDAGTPPAAGSFASSGRGARRMGMAEPPSPAGTFRGHARRPRAMTDGYPNGGGPAPTPAKYENRGYCTTHTTVEAWASTGAPDPSPGGHAIQAGSHSFVRVP